MKKRRTRETATVVERKKVWGCNTCPKYKKNVNNCLYQTEWFCYNQKGYKRNADLRTPSRLILVFYRSYGKKFDIN